MPTITLPKVKALRIDMGLTQSELSDISGVSLRTIQRVELGNNATLDTARALAATFSLPSYHALLPDDKKQESEIAPTEQLKVSQTEFFQGDDDGYDIHKLLKFEKWAFFFIKAVLLLIIVSPAFVVAVTSSMNDHYEWLLGVPAVSLFYLSVKYTNRWLKTPST